MTIGIKAPIKDVFAMVPGPGVGVERGQRQGARPRWRSRAHGITLFDASRPDGDRLFASSHLNDPDRRPNVFDHSIGIGARKLHAQAVTFSGAYEELVAFVTSFSSAIQHGFPEGEALLGAALGKR
jgi:hypothetical protein